MRGTAATVIIVGTRFAPIITTIATRATGRHVPSAGRWPNLKWSWGMVEHDFSEALYWFKRSADRGNAASQYEMGLANEKGNGISKNESEAARWYKISADRGNAPANLSLGILYEKGRGVPLSLPKAADCYRKAGGAGHALAGYNLGKMYEEGRGVQKDLGEALFWYEKAGKLGNAAAMTDWQRLRGTDKRWLHPEK